MEREGQWMDFRLRRALGSHSPRGANQTPHSQIQPERDDGSWNRTHRPRHLQHSVCTVRGELAHLRLLRRFRNREWDFHAYSEFTPDIRCQGREARVGNDNGCARGSWRPCTNHRPLPLSSDLVYYRGRHRTVVLPHLLQGFRAVLPSGTFTPVAATDL